MFHMCHIFRDLVREELLESINQVDEARLKHALGQARLEDVDYKYPHPHSCTLLHLAAQKNSPELVQLLLDKGANPNSRVGYLIRIKMLSSLFLFFCRI